MIAWTGFSLAQTNALTRSRNSIHDGHSYPRKSSWRSVHPSDSYGSPRAGILGGKFSGERIQEGTYITVSPSKPNDSDLVDTLPTPWATLDVRRRAAGRVHDL